ncbi:SRPBCC family protein [Colwellia echini]|uniref:SRPBCC family protein n=1 Tax=Colwellia echini TaxID=1982103 RepID=A0ABY3N075_9GAMM|nr:SRPBCC family protein [Colwellia echini]TYK66883.1 hypothetical protein CWS31_003620 [Colwellia echini]
MNFSVETTINRPVNEVWAAITDIANSANMISAIIDLTVLKQGDDDLIGFKWSETREMFGKEATETMWITDCEHEQYYCTRAENCGAIYLTTMSVTGVEDQCVLTMTFTGTADSIFIRAMSNIMGFFMKNSMTKMLKQDLQDIKTFVENKQK